MEAGKDDGRMKEPSTVREMIEALQGFRPDLKIYTRPKYTGEADWTKDYPVNVSGVSEMDKGEVGEEHVCILF